MFNNKFNNRNADPLVEAVKAAQADGEMRRQAIAHVNEQFGVYNRNAVIRENLAAYDAAIEEAYKCMKEGKPLSPKQQKMASIAGDPKKIDAADLASLRKGAKIDEKKGCYEEGMDSDVVGGGAVTKDSKPVVSATAPKVDTSGPSAADKAGLASKIGAMKEAKLDEWRDRPKKDDVNRRKRDAVAMKIGLNNPEDRNEKYNRPVSMLKHGRKLMKAGVTKEETIEEAVSRKHFQQVADLIKGHESQEKRNELASHHAGIFAKQNPRFNHEKFHTASGSTAHQAKTVKESVLAAVRAKYMKEDQGF